MCFGRGREEGSRGPSLDRTHRVGREYPNHLFPRCVLIGRPAHPLSQSSREKVGPLMNLRDAVRLASQPAGEGVPALGQRSTTTCFISHELFNGHGLRRVFFFFSLWSACPLFCKTHIHFDSFGAFEACCRTEIQKNKDSPNGSFGMYSGGTKTMFAGFYREGSRYNRCTIRTFGKGDKLEEKC